LLIYNKTEFVGDLWQVGGFLRVVSFQARKCKKLDNAYFPRFLPSDLHGGTQHHSFEGLRLSMIL
jgi:hypothetical protein